ncbi:hypothetical protein VTJ04DRAFT_6032 [Mycothermus thermophilus]|uniref:uncharacterized protein n=1 Tax=Humicola insolens TaxID=85995 RepID=UPI0037431BF4
MPLGFTVGILYTFRLLSIVALAIQRHPKLMYIESDTPWCMTHPNHHYKVYKTSHTKLVSNMPPTPFKSSRLSSRLRLLFTRAPRLSIFPSPDATTFPCPSYPPRYRYTYSTVRNTLPFSP